MTTLAQDPAAAITAPPNPAPPRRWPWVLLALVALLVLAAAVAAAQLLSLLAGGLDGWQLVVNGEDLLGRDIGVGPVLGAVAALLLALLVVVIVVPLAVGLTLLAASVGVGLAVLVLAALALVALSPILLPLLLIGWLLRRPRGGPAAGGTIAS
jgi:hypothetical protein